MIDPKALEDFHALQGRVEERIRELEAYKLKRIDNFRERDKKYRAKHWLRRWLSRTLVLDDYPWPENFGYMYTAVAQADELRVVINIISPLIDTNLGLDKPGAKAIAPRVTDVDAGIFTLDGARMFDGRRRSLVFPFRFRYPERAAA